MVALFIFLTGMTGALAPFSYLVSYNVRPLLSIPPNLRIYGVRVLLPAIKLG
jgi:hypothetical protein